MLCDRPAVRPRPRGLLRLFFQVPTVLYRALSRIGRADLMRQRMILLTTRGRRSGRPRTCALNYAIADGTVYVMSGFGRTDWLRNLEADPHVEMSLGQEHWSAEARTVVDPAERRRAIRAARDQALTQGPPRPIRPLLCRLGLDYDAEIRKLDGPDLGLPVVAITTSQAGPSATSWAGWSGSPGRPRSERSDRRAGAE